MMGKGTGSLTVDLDQSKLFIALSGRINLTLHFNTPSRAFYLSVIALVVHEMKRSREMSTIPLKQHHALLALLNNTVGKAAGSSREKNLLSRIYNKWCHALPRLEDATLFAVPGKKKERVEGAGRGYAFTEAEQDMWANLFEYKGSHENVRLKFAVDKIGLTLDDIAIVYEGSADPDAWDAFVAGLETDRRQDVPEETPVPVASPVLEKKSLFSSGYRLAALAALVVLLLGFTVLELRKTQAKKDREDIISVDKMAFPLPQGPSFAVLPFANMSGDPTQDFLADGITEEVITALSRVPRVFVIARSSTDTYKRKNVGVKQVSRELGIRYVIEGSVQRSGGRVRITAQLIDALNGYHLWANSYDRDLKDLFGLQDEIVMKVLANVEKNLMPSRAYGGEETVGRYYRGERGLDCYLKLREGKGHLDRFTIQDDNAARVLIEEAIDMLPDNPVGYQLLGWVYHQDYVLGNTQSPRETLEKGLKIARKALAMEESAAAHVLLCRFYLLQRDFDRAVVEGQKAMAIDPVYSTSSYALCLVHAGKPEEAVPLLQRAIRRDPFGPTLHLNLGLALRLAGRLEEAAAANQKAIQIAPNNIIAHLNQAAVYGLMGRQKEAHAEVEEVRRINPKFSLDSWNAHSALSKEQFSARERRADPLQKAGLK